MPTPAPPPLRRQTCLIFGDPHIQTFDSSTEVAGGQQWSQKDVFFKQSPRLMHVREKQCKDFCGLHWLVRSEEIKIQGQYGGSWTFLQALAVSGSFLHGHVLVIHTDGTVTWDGAQVVSTFPAKFQNEFVRLRYYKDDAFRRFGYYPSFHILQTMRIHFPHHVMLTVNVVGRWWGPRFLDAIITLSPPVGCDGHCGKGDGDVADDNMRYFTQHISQWRVSPEDSLISRQLSLASDAAQVTAKYEGSESECWNGTFDEAQALCRSALPDNSTEAWVQTCSDDVCAIGPDMANHTAAITAQAQEILMQEDIMATGSCHTCSQADDCFKDVAWAMEVGISSGFYRDKRFIPQVDEHSCFEEVQSALRAWQQSDALNEWTAGMKDQKIEAPCHDSAGTNYQKHGLTYCR